VAPCKNSNRQFAHPSAGTSVSAGVNLTRVPFEIWPMLIFPLFYAWGVFMLLGEMALDICLFAKRGTGYPLPSDERRQKMACEDVLGLSLAAARLHPTGSKGAAPSAGIRTTRGGVVQSAAPNKRPGRTATLGKLGGVGINW